MTVNGVIVAKAKNGGKKEKKGEKTPFLLVAFEV